MEKPVYPSGMSRAERRKLRDEYAAFLMSRKQEGRPVQVKVVERVIEKTVKPDLSGTLAKMEAAAARAAQPEYNFKRELLEAERAESEDLAAVDRRLITEFGELEIRRPLQAEDETRRQRLYRNLYRFRG